MSITLTLKEEYDAIVDWKQIALALKEEYRITSGIEDIETFLQKLELKHLKLKTYTPEIESIFVNDMTGDIVDG